MGFTSNTLLIPKQDLVMVYIVYRFNQNNERKGTNEKLKEISSNDIA